jgi:hypothetical protein
MSELSIQALSPQKVVSGVLRQLNQERIDDGCRLFHHGFSV